MQEPRTESVPTAIHRPASAPILDQYVPAWLLTTALAVLAGAVAFLLLVGVPAGR